MSSGIIRDAPGPVSMNIYPVVDYYPVYTSTQQVHGLGYRQETIRFKPPKKRRECCGFALKTWFSFFLVLLIIAAVSVLTFLNVTYFLCFFILKKLTPPFLSDFL